MTQPPPRVGEVQLTDAIARLATADQTFAQGFWKLVVDAARQAQDQVGAHARALADPVGVISCRTEHRAGELAGKIGRCDLWFEAVGPPPVTLAIEAKLGARYQELQVERYLQEILRHDPGEAGLVVITGRNHPEISRAVAADGRWLGEVRWGQLSENGLLDLPFEPDNQHLKEEWRSLIEALCQNRRLGIDSVDPERFAKWATGDASRETATILLEDIVPLAQASLDDALRPFGLRSISVPSTGGHRVHLQDGSEVSLVFDIDGRGSRVEFLLTQPMDEDDRVQMQVWFLPSPTQTDFYLATDGERRATFEYSDLDHAWAQESPVEPQTSATDLRAMLMEYWELALRGLADLGAFAP